MPTPAAAASICLVAGLLTTACQADRVTAPDRCGAVDVVVGAGDRPTISWSPACPASYVTVADSVMAAESGFALWVWDTKGQNVLLPPLQYGVRSAEVTYPADGIARPLVPGRRYTVNVIAAVPKALYCLDFLVVCDKVGLGKAQFTR